MGGSGGGYFSGGADPSELSRKIRQAEETARDDRFEAEVSGFLASELSGYNDRDHEAIRQVLDAVEADLKGEIEGAVDLLFGGSVAKHTYVDGLSDVDALVCMNRSDIAGKSPEDLRKIFADRLVARYGRDAVYEGNMAVTLTLGGKTIQLLPATRDGNGFKVASSDGTKWASIRPREFAAALTKANEKMGGKLVPTVKLAKALNATLPEQRQLTGYHVESLAINVFKGYTGDKTPKAMLRHFFENAPEHIRTPIKDSTGQSIHVDDYLGPANSTSRRTIADAVGRIGKRIKNADGAQSVDLWRSLFSEGK